MKPSVSETAKITDKYIDAATPGGAIAHAVKFCPDYMMVRPSSRSFTYWVAVFYFHSKSTADAFANDAKNEYAIPYAIVRFCGGYWLASVPVKIEELPSAASGQLPFKIFDLDFGDEDIDF